MTTAWPDMFRATRLRFAVWPYYLLAGEPAYRRLWILTLGAGVTAFATRIALLITVVEASRFGLGPPQYILYEGLAAFACAPVSGLLIDWRSPRRVLIGVELTAMTALAGFAMAGMPALLPLLIIVLGGCAVVHQAARDACLLDTLPARRVTRASGLDQAASWGAIVAGPLAGAALIDGFDLFAVAAILAIAHAVLLLVAGRLPERRGGTAIAWRRVMWPRATLKRTGVAVLVVFGLSALTGSIWIAVAPPMIVDVWQSAPSWIGVQVAAAGIMAIGGSLAAPGLIRRIGIGPAMVRLSLAEALAFAAYALSPTLIVATIAVGAIGLIAGAFLAAFYASLQHSAEEAERGRLFALVRQIDAAALLLAGLVTSAMAQTLTPATLLVVAAAVYVAAAVLFGARQRQPERGP